MSDLRIAVALAALLSLPAFATPIVTDNFNSGTAGSLFVADGTFEPGGPASNGASCYNTWQGTAGALEINSTDTVSTENCYLRTISAFNVTGGWAQVKVPLVSSSSGGTALYLYSGPAAWHRMLYYPTDGKLYIQHNAGAGIINDTSIVYTSTNHKYWRLRESGGAITAYASPDGITWTAIGSAITSAVTATTVRAAIGTEGAAGNATANNARFDDFIADDGASVTPTALTLSCAPTTVANSGTSTCTAGTNGTITGGTTYSVTVTAAGGTLATAGTITGSPCTLDSTHQTCATTYTAPASGSGTNTISASTTGLTAPANVTMTVTVVGSTISVSNANWFWSPYNTYISGSNYAKQTNNGAYFRLAITGTTQASLTVDVSELVAAGAAGSGTNASQYPAVLCSVNNGPYALNWLTSASSSISLGTGWSTGSVYAVHCILKGQSYSLDRWATMAGALKVTGLTVDSGGSLAAPALRPNRLLIYGDSITEAGGQSTGTGPVYDADASLGYALALCRAFSAECGIVGYSAQGLTQAGQGNVPAAQTAWSNVMAGVSRLSGGAFVPAPNRIFVMHGQNDQNGAYATVKSAYQTFYGNLRAAAPAAKIAQVIPCSGAGGASSTATESTAVLDAYNAAKPGDANLYLVDLGVVPGCNLTNTGATEMTSDGVHLTPRGHLRQAAVWAQAIQAAEVGTTVINAPSSHQIIRSR